jgi:hypothetical protein
MSPVVTNSGDPPRSGESTKLGTRDVAENSTGVRLAGPAGPVERTLLGGL